MLQEPFSEGVSPIHRLAPVPRISAAIIGAVCLSLIRQPESALAALGIAAFMLALSAPPPLPLLRRLAVVNLFVLLLWLTVPFTTSGEEVMKLGPLAVTRQGMTLAWLVSLKVNALVMLFLALVATMSIPALGAALKKLGLPDRLTALLLFSYRYIHVIGAEWNRLYTAARLRGFAPRTDRWTYKTVGTLLGMLFVRSVKRAGRIHEAMRLRGFSGRFYMLDDDAAKLPDILFAAALALACAVPLCWEVFHG